VAKVTYWDGNGVKPREDISRKELIQRHSSKAVPEISERFRVLDFLPMQTLECFDGRQVTPEHGVDVPNRHRTHHTTQTITEEANGNGTQDHSGGTQRHVVEEILSGKDLNTCGSIRSGSSCDGADGMFFEAPRTRVDELDNLEPERYRASVTAGSPPSFELVSARKGEGPSVSDEVGDEDDECSLDGDHGGFELADIR